MTSPSRWTRRSSSTSPWATDSSHKAGLPLSLLQRLRLRRAIACRLLLKGPVARSAHNPQARTPLAGALRVGELRLYLVAIVMALGLDWPVRVLRAGSDSAGRQLGLPVVGDLAVDCQVGLLAPGAALAMQNIARHRRDKVQRVAQRRALRLAGHGRVPRAVELAGRALPARRQRYQDDSEQKPLVHGFLLSSFRRCLSLTPPHSLCRFPTL